MGLNALGQIVQEEWLRTPQIRSEIELDEFVIMPNHFHAIVIITAVGAHGVRPLNVAGVETRAHRRAPLHRSPRTLGSLMAGFKSACTRRINRFFGNTGTSVWQRNYYEHVIRKDEELDSVRQYIVTNPLYWQFDRYNSPTRESPS